MLQQIRAFLADLVAADQETPRFDADDRRLAVAALLAHVIGIDGFVSAEERARLEDVLARHFSLSVEDARALADAGREAELESVDLYRFTSVVKRGAPLEERLAVVEMLWELVYADGVVHEFEDNVVWRIADLIGVETRDRVLIRQEVAAGVAKTASETAEG
ncbi:TerB family tellurite resistance protein [Methyloraptor flagellatus]|uniref:TerB family tellurite resistance protein n=1 Tax=Methyloraptor flagellatus TaxID=3162530 RepID=A0AAU7X7U1_9HYPH